MDPNGEETFKFESSVVGGAIPKEYTAKVKVSALSARSQPDGHATVHIEVEVKDKDELAGVINKLNNIQGVYHVARVSGK